MDLVLEFIKQQHTVASFMSPLDDLNDPSKNYK